MNVRSSTKGPPCCPIIGSALKILMLAGCFHFHSRVAPAPTTIILLTLNDLRHKF